VVSSGPINFHPSNFDGTTVKLPRSGGIYLDADLIVFFLSRLIHYTAPFSGWRFPVSTPALGFLPNLDPFNLDLDGSRFSAAALVRIVASQGGGGWSSIQGWSLIHLTATDGGNALRDFRHTQRQP
jgi:hypothetical protein